MKLVGKNRGEITALFFFVFILLPLTTIYAESGRVTASELKSMIEKGGKITLIDVRTPEEYNEEHIPGAINLPVDKFYDMRDFPHKDNVVLYCTVGVRSMRAKKILAGKGIKGIIDLEGGINGWIKNSGKTEKPQKTADVKKNSDDEIYSDYPDTYIVPKGVCEQGLEPSMIIKK
ncbi:MAG: rhodanese-like domain-containing protein [Deltaproteobacteria bacterium]|nr:rhodanese-like domain-containing protein [Deltaproteobacteria bacterium]MBI5893188.1 rhodanese-like domain-containing protein [Deltaproteobacteria bacterium]